MHLNIYICQSVSQFSHSVMSDSLQPYEPQHARPPCPSPTLRATQTHVQRVGDAIQPSHRLSSPSPPALNLSQHHGLFKWVWSFSFNISPSNEHPGLTSFRMDWLDLLAVQGTLKSLLQYIYLKKQNTYTWKTINHWWKKSKRTQTGGEIYCVHGLEESILSKRLCPKQSIDSMQSLSSYQRYFSQN